jgi:sirohydrochlorin ferrochelatase
MPSSLRNGVVLLGHGSPEPATSDEMRALRDEIAARLPGQRVAHAFLNQDPRLESAVEDLIRQGCAAVRVLPVLVFTGRHMAHDVPAEIARLRERHPDVVLELDPHLFRQAGFAALLADSLRTPEGLA